MNQLQKLVSTVLVLFSFHFVFAQKSGFNIKEFYPIEASHSYVGFSVKYMGYAMVKGRFEKFNGTFRYDENDITKTSVSFAIETNSIDSDLEWRDKDLKSANWLDAEKYPLIKFESTKTIKSANGFIVTGNLTIKDVTKEVSIQMNPASGVLKDIRGDSQVIMTGGITIDRTEYNVKGERWSKVKENIAAVANEVKIELSILGKQLNLSNLKNWVSRETTPPGKIYKTIKDNGIEAGLKVFDTMKADTESKVKINVNALNIVGYVLMKEGNMDDALAVMEKNLEAFPDDPNAYDSYAAVLANKGKLKKAKKYYSTALEKNPKNLNASEILRNMK